MFNMRSQLDKIIITAMDRFVWFVVLVVMSHLVTEFTRVTGYGRGPRNEFVIVNDTLMQPRQVQSLLFLPGQEYGLYEAADVYHANNNNNNNYQNNAPIIMAPATAAGGDHNSNGNGNIFNFSFRPLIDSIFEIPISTLRAVNNLVARLTGSYQQTPKSAAAIVFDASTLPGSASSTKGVKKSLLREEIA